MKKIASKQRSGWDHCHLTYNWNMSVLIAQKVFVIRGRAQKILTIIVHTLQMTQAMNLPEVKPKQFFYIGCD
jgi:hypothetical protein